VYLTGRGLLQPPGRFRQLIENIRKNIELEPNNPEAHYRLATYSWDKASRDFRLSDKEKAQIIADGLASVDKALSIKPTTSKR
jgi:hypothetical protein